MRTLGQSTVLGMAFLTAAATAANADPEHRARSNGRHRGERFRAIRLIGISEPPDRGFATRRCVAVDPKQRGTRRGYGLSAALFERRRPTCQFIQRAESGALLGSIGLSGKVALHP